MTKNLDKHFGGVAAIDRCRYPLKKGKITGIVGPNGCGQNDARERFKRVFPYERGRGRIDGVELKKISAPEVASYGVTRTFQEVRLFNQMPVLDNILSRLPNEMWSAHFLKNITRSISRGRRNCSEK